MYKRKMRYDCHRENFSQETKWFSNLSETFTAYINLWYTFYKSVKNFSHMKVLTRLDGQIDRQRVFLCSLPCIAQGKIKKLMSDLYVIYGNWRYQGNTKYTSIVPFKLTYSKILTVVQSPLTFIFWNSTKN